MNVKKNGEGNFTLRKNTVRQQSKRIMENKGQGRREQRQERRSSESVGDGYKILVNLI
jgi:hypothetical protein